ncbi:MAG TPA: hypothetical protein VHV09_25815 [Trebonia sp.]|nr:hypothetical protein [Trebonia sp.]
MAKQDLIQQLLRIAETTNTPADLFALATAASELKSAVSAQKVLQAADKLEKSRELTLDEIGLLASVHAILENMLASRGAERLRAHAATVPCQQVTAVAFVNKALYRSANFHTKG